MKRDLRSMAGDPEKNAGTQSQPSANDMQFLQNAAAMYQGKSQSELMEELMQQAAKEREKGTLSPAMLDQVMNSVGPMLTPEQRIRMAQLIDQIK